MPHSLSNVLEENLELAASGPILTHQPKTKVRQIQPVILNAMWVFVPLALTFQLLLSFLPESTPHAILEPLT
jgi:hypothetical protein